MKIRYLLVTALIIGSVFHGTGLALNLSQSRPVQPQQPLLVQPMAEKRPVQSQPKTLASWVRFSSKYYHLVQRSR
jgi:hypothetical protein